MSEKKEFKIVVYEKQIKCADGTKFPKLKCCYTTKSGERRVHDFILPSKNSTVKDDFKKYMVKNDLVYPVEVTFGEEDYLLIENKKKDKVTGKTFKVINFVLYKWDAMTQTKFEQKKTTLDDVECDALFD